MIYNICMRKPNKFEKYLSQLRNKIKNLEKISKTNTQEIKYLRLAVAWIQADRGERISEIKNLEKIIKTKIERRLPVRRNHKTRKGMR